jgi:hypothetical protein
VRNPFWVLVFSSALVFSLTVCSTDSWDVFKSDDYGFAMLVPSNNKGVVFEKNGWRGMMWNINGVKFFGLAKKGSYKNDVIRQSAARLSGISDGAFKLVDKGAKINGWNWYETYQAIDGANTVCAVVGEGPSASHILYLVTTVKDLQANQAAYLKWYSSLAVFKAKRF